MRFLIEFVARMPRVSLVFGLLLLILIAGCSAYAGILVIGSISRYLDTSRFVAGLLLGLAFLRLPSFKEGKLRTKGLVPKPARLPLMLILLAACLVSYLGRNEVRDAVFIGLAMGILLVTNAIRSLVKSRVASFFTEHQRSASAEPAAGPSRAADPNVIDVDFREPKD